jgi:hypothetical protein
VPSQISWAKKKATASFSLRLRGREGKQNELGKDLKPRSPVVGPQEEPDMTSRGRKGRREVGGLILSDTEECKAGTKGRNCRKEEIQVHEPFYSK